MKLAEALLQRADLQTRLAELSQRLQKNAVHQEGEPPQEDCAALLADYRQTQKALTALIVRINLANYRVQLADGTALVAALAQRDSLRQEHRMLQTLADSASGTGTRYSRSEIRLLAAVNVSELRTQANELAKRFRELDVAIQQANWNEEL